MDAGGRRPDSARLLRAVDLSEAAEGTRVDRTEVPEYTERELPRVRKRSLAQRAKERASFMSPCPRRYALRAPPSRMASSSSTIPWPMPYSFVWKTYAANLIPRSAFRPEALCARTDASAASNGSGRPCGDIVRSIMRRTRRGAHAPSPVLLNRDALSLNSIAKRCILARRSHAARTSASVSSSSTHTVTARGALTQPSSRETTSAFHPPAPAASSAVQCRARAHRLHTSSASTASFHAVLTRAMRHRSAGSRNESTRVTRSRGRKAHKVARVHKRNERRRIHACRQHKNTHAHVQEGAIKMCTHVPTRMQLRRRAVCARQAPSLVETATVTDVSKRAPCTLR
eukprot:Opistho-1_new@98924